MGHRGESRGPGRNLEGESRMRVSKVGVSAVGVIGGGVVCCLLFSDVAKWCVCVRESECVCACACARPVCASKVNLRSRKHWRRKIKKHVRQKTLARSGWRWQPSFCYGCPGRSSCKEG